MWRTPQAGTTARVRRAIAATRAISPRAGRAAGSGVMAALPVIENLLDRPLEQAGEPEGQRQRGIVFPGLDRVDRLARDSEPAAKLRLAPVPLGSQHLQTVLHWFPHDHRGVPPGVRRGSPGTNRGLKGDSHCVKRPLHYVAE